LNVKNYQKIEIKKKIIAKNCRFFQKMPFTFFWKKDKFWQFFEKNVKILASFLL